MHLHRLRDDSLPLSTHSLPAAVPLCLYSWLVRNQLLGLRWRHASKNPKKGFRCNTENEDTKLSTIERTNVNVPRSGGGMLGLWGVGRRFFAHKHHLSCSETSQDKTRTEALRGVRGSDCSATRVWWLSHDGGIPLITAQRSQVIRASGIKRVCVLTAHVSL